MGTTTHRDLQLPVFSTRSRRPRHRQPAGVHHLLRLLLAAQLLTLLLALLILLR